MREKDALTKKKINIYAKPKYKPIQ
jgi:hypothetical protein